MSPFKKLARKGTGAFWMMGSIWNALIEALGKDRIVVVQGGGITETPIADGGRAISVGGAGSRVRFRWNMEGEAHYFDVVANDAGLASEIDGA